RSEESGHRGPRAQRQASLRRPPIDESTSALRTYERGDEPTDEDDRPENTQDSGRARSWRRPKEYYSGRDPEAGYEIEADRSYQVANDRYEPLGSYGALTQ